MKLTIIGLPLGNIEDISARAIDALASAKLIICEDTRMLNKLWQKLSQSNLLPPKTTAQLAVLNDFNENNKSSQIIELIRTHQPAVLVSDAGLPLISDPGYKLLQQLLTTDIDLDIIPGPTAATTALAISGLPTDHFLFLGFLPQKTSKITRLLEPLTNLNLGLTLILYESPHRLLKTITRLQDYFSLDTPIVIAKELTKTHQKIYRSTLSSIHDNLPKAEIKGEFTLLLRLNPKS